MSSKPLKVRKSRNHDMSLLDACSPFEPHVSRTVEGTCGNIASELGHIYDRVSAPYLLSRLCAAFNGLKIDVGGQENYKTTWDVVLTHRETGHIVTFYDYKGSASFGSDVYGKDAPESFRKDVAALVNALCSDRFPHPYDGCVVGEVA